MREIKFRAWDKEVGGMVYDVMAFEMRSLGYYDDQLNHKSCSQKCDRPCKEDNGFIGYLSDCPAWVMMQYTGLKDKNGVEIYEGDVLDHTNETNPTYFNHFRAVVEWCDGGFRLRYHVPKMGAERLAQLEDHEDVNPTFFAVIGNIYENPDLVTSFPA